MLMHLKSFLQCSCPGHIAWEPAFVQLDDHPLKKSKLVATIPVLEKEWRIVFEVQIQKTKGGGNILHMTTAGKGISTHNYIPIVSLHPSRGFKVAFHVNGEILERSFPKSAPTVGQQWYEIQIIQVLEDSKYVYGIFIDKKKVLSVENGEPESYENVNVYMTSPWYKSQKGSIRGMRIENRKPEEKTSETSLLDFYNNVMTFNESLVEATCCTMEGSPISVSCGRGTSCSAVCYSNEATLCPSHDCKDCETLKEEGKKERQGFSVATYSASAFKHCIRNGCQVSGGSKFCCFHPQCGRKQECSFMRYLLGELQYSFKTLIQTLLCRKFMPPSWSYCSWRMDVRETTSSDSRHSRPQREPGDLPRCDTFRVR